MAAEKIVRIGGASGFWGDSRVAAPQLVASGAVEQVAGDRLDAVLAELVAHRAVAEAGDADDAARRRRPLGQARQRRPHLAGNAEDEKIALDRRQIVDERARRPGEKVVERLDRSEAIGQGRRVEEVHVSLAFAGPPQFSGASPRGAQGC